MTESSTGKPRNFKIKLSILVFIASFLFFSFNLIEFIFDSSNSQQDDMGFSSDTVQKNENTVPTKQNFQAGLAKIKSKEAIHPDFVARSAQDENRLRAYADIKKGHLILKSWGYPANWSNTYDELMLSKYQIEVQSIAGCIITEIERLGANAYNDVMLPEIDHRFGKDVFEKTATEAKRLFTKNQLILDRLRPDSSNKTQQVYQILSGPFASQKEAQAGLNRLKKANPVVKINGWTIEGQPVYQGGIRRDDIQKQKSPEQSIQLQKDQGKYWISLGQATNRDSEAYQLAEKVVKQAQQLVIKRM